MVRFPDRRHAVITLIAAVCSIAVGVACAGEDPFQLPAPVFSDVRIAIHCSAGVLQLWKDTEMVREYPVHIGKGGLGKRRSGDHKTPLGDFRISWMASRLSDKGRRIIDEKSWCSNNRFVYADRGPPLEKLWSRAYGGPEAAVMSIDYPNAKQAVMGYTGDCIHIHAVRSLDDGALKRSYGCIHMFPADALELYELVDQGTPVKILP